MVFFAAKFINAMNTQLLNLEEESAMVELKVAHFTHFRLSNITTGIKVEQSQ